MSSRLIRKSQSVLHRENPEDDLTSPVRHAQQQEHFNVQREEQNQTVFAQKRGVLELNLKQLCLNNGIENT